MKEFTLTLTEGEANTILTGLLELPAKISIDVINKVRGQALQQIAEHNAQSEQRDEEQK